MSGEIEHAEEYPNTQGFPESWGAPRGSAFSAERAAWVAGHARRAFLSRKGYGKTPAERRAYLERKRRTP